MNTIKIFLAESGRIASLHKDFPLYRGQFNDKLLNVYVPTSILAPSFSIQHYIGQILGTTAPTSLELADFVAANTYPSREPAQGDIVEFCDTDDQEFFIYEFNGTSWASTQVDSFGTLNTIAGTSIKIGMTATKRNGTVYTSKSYFMRYLKTLTYQNVEYALYERKLPKEFTMFAGQGQNAPILIANVVNVDTSDKTVLSLVTSQTCALDVMESTMLDQDEPIEASSYEELEADVNTLSAKLDLKQDQKSNELSTVADHIVPAINEVNTKVLTIDAQINEEGGLADRLTTAEGDIDNIEAEQRTQNASIKANTDDIQGTEETKGLLERVGDLENTVITSETYIVTKEGSSLPTSAQLSGWVVEKADREPQGGDYIYFILQVSGGTDKNYKYTYSSVSGWNGAEIPATEKADNSTYGIVKGSYTGNTNADFQVNIQNGEFSGIYVVDNNSTLRDVGVYLNNTASSLADNISQTNTNKNNISTNTGNISTLQGQMTNILNGSTAVGKATSADNDGNGRNIVGTYLTQTAGVTKTQMRNYALPRAFNDVSFLEANNAYGDTIPQGSSPLYTATSSNIGDTTIMYANKTVGNYTFQLGSKNSYTTTMYLTASADCTVAYRLTTEVYLNGDWVLLNAELTDPITMVAGVVKKVNFGSPFNSLSEIIEVNENDIIRQTLEVVTETSSSITFSVYSNETYPSTFYLNTTAQTIITAQGELGEIPSLNLYGVLDNDTISYEIPEGIILNNNTIVMLNLYYADDIESGTYIDLKYGLQQVKILTPYNLDAQNTATVDELKQAYIDTNVIKFIALIQEDNGDYYAIANIDNLADVNSAITNLQSGKQNVIDSTHKLSADLVDDTDTTNKFVTANDKSTWSGKQDALPTTSTAGQVLKSTSTSGTVEWGSIPDTNTWRPIKVDGTEKLTNSTSGNALDLVGGTNVTLTESNGAVTISATDTTYSSLTASQGGTNVSLVTTGEKYTWNSKQDALSQTQLDAVNSGIDSTKVGQIATNTTNIGTNTGDIATINGKIPTEASSNNQLADKSFVNSSIQTATANFRGNWATWSDVPTVATDYPEDYAQSKTPTVNDYMVVEDASGYTGQTLTGTWRFKYSGVWATNGKNGWLPEYQVNETPLTSAQLSALNSGITDTLVAQIGTNQTNIANKMDKANAVGSGSFSIDRKAGTTTGTSSTTFGVRGTANQSYSFAEGYYTTASGQNAHSMGNNTVAKGKSQFAFGEYNVQDSVGGGTTRGQYIEIVGNGTSSTRSNARTLDWDGNEYLAGKLQANGGLTDGNNANYELHLPDTTSWTADKTIATTDQIPASQTITITTTSGSESVSDGTNTLNFGANAFTNTAIPTTYVSSVNGQSGAVTGLQPTISAGTGISISSNTVSLNGVIPYTTTAPTAANNTGVKIAILSSEPATKYAGWLYFITE